MKTTKFRVSRSGYLIFLMLASCVPAVAQRASGLGGSFNDPAGGMVTKTIVDRMARRRRAKTRTIPTGSDAAVRFRSTGTQLKTREIANTIDAGNAQVFTIMSAILTEYEKGARASGHPNDLALALSFFFATNASIYHDAGQPADPPMMELRDVIAETLVEGNALNGVSDRQKQEMYETLVIFTGFALATYQEGKQGGNAETVKVSRQLAGQNLLAITGISPDKIAFTDQGLSIDNGSAAADDSASTSNSSSAPASAIQRDPFPDRPGYAPQKPLSGTLKDSITMDDLVGRWDHGAGSVQTYVDSSTGNYAGTTTSFYGEQIVVRSNGSFDYKFVGRANNTTVRETDRGTVILSGGYVTFKFEGRLTKKYQFIAFNIQPAGAAILSLVEVHDTFQGYDAAGLALECGHGDGFIRCVGGEEWARLGGKPVEPVEVIQPSQNALRNQDTVSETINAGKLVIDFEGNEVRALQMYGGKRIRVNGTVNSIDVQKNGLIVLTFHSPAGGYAQTQCYFNKSQSSRLAQLSGGQQAIVEGTVKGIGGGLGGRGFVVMEDCIVP
jgi:tRNA_anti-like